MSPSAPVRMPVMERLRVGLAWRRECDLHPHCPDERAELFASVEAGSAELEVLEFLYALLRMAKPGRVLETGTGSGWTTIALAAGLQENGDGELHSIELDASALGRARSNMRAFAPELEPTVSFHETGSIEFIQTWDGGAFDFALFDSLIAFRHTEFEALLARDLLAPGALCVFHDTSRTRGQTMHDYNPEMIAALDRHAEGAENLEFGLSRGLRIIRAPRDRESSGG